MIIREHEKGDLLELSCNQLFNSISDANKFVNKIVNKWDKKGFYWFSTDGCINKNKTIKLKSIWIKKGNN